VCAAGPCACPAAGSAQGAVFPAAARIGCGTLFGNPLSAAAAKATLTQVLVPGACAHTTALGRQLADGIDQAIKAAGLPLTVIRLGPSSGQWYGPMPRIEPGHTPSPTTRSPG
jgi:glutamate-1-semialdehyde 2,1-aminomutase